MSNIIQGIKAMEGKQEKLEKRVEELG